MPALNHVCMWSEKGWKRISAEEAALLHPEGTVSAHSGLFMCELCGQYVSFTGTKNRIRHFKHRASEKSKNCPERKLGPDYIISHDARQKESPVYICDISPDSFRFKIGLPAVPIELIKDDMSIELFAGEEQRPYRSYKAGRFSDRGITYIPADFLAYCKCRLQVVNGSKELFDYWPEEIPALDPEGTIFDAKSKKKLPYDADVIINKEYYLLKGTDYFSKENANFSVKKIAEKSYAGKMFTIYSVYAKQMNEDAAKFFSDLHCRLTDTPSDLQQVWPLYTENDSLRVHNSDTLYLLPKGNIYNLSCFPTTQQSICNIGDTEQKLYLVKSFDRQQLISVGRTHALKYAYFRKEPLTEEAPAPGFSVTDLKNNSISPGCSHNLPYEGKLLFSAEFDGKVKIFLNDSAVNTVSLKADTVTEISVSSYGTYIKLLIGLDTVWEITFRKQDTDVNDKDEEFLQYITDVSGPLISVPHAMSNMLCCLQNYPKVCRYIRKRIKIGTVREKAYRRIQILTIKLSTKQKE